MTDYSVSLLSMIMFHLKERDIQTKPSKKSWFIQSGGHRNLVSATHAVKKCLYWFLSSPGRSWLQIVVCQLWCRILKSLLCAHPPKQIHSALPWSSSVTTVHFAFEHLPRNSVFTHTQMSPLYRPFRMHFSNPATDPYHLCSFCNILIFKYRQVSLSVRLPQRTAEHTGFLTLIYHKVV